MCETRLLTFHGMRSNLLFEVGRPYTSCWLNRASYSWDMHNGAKTILKWYLNCFTSLRFHDFLMDGMELKIDLNISSEICGRIEIWMRLHKDLAPLWQGIQLTVKLTPQLQTVDRRVSEGRPHLHMFLGKVMTSWYKIDINSEGHFLFSLLVRGK